MTFTTRRITTGEGALLKRVRLAALLDTPSAFAKTYDEESAYPDDFWVSRAADNAAGREHATFLAFDGDECVGLVGGHHAGTGLTIELVSMWTDPAARGNGVGAMLVDAVIEWADGSTIELWVTRGNDAAERLYERCGFVVTDEVAPLPSDPCKEECRMRRRSS